MSAPQIILYTYGTPNGQKVSITLEELAIEYKCEKIDIISNTQKEDWFKAINPNAKIPAIKDGDFALFESGAIMQYLVDKYDTERKISFEIESEDYYRAMAWVHWQVGGVGPTQGQISHFRFFAQARSDYATKRFTDEAERLFSVLETSLKDTEYLVANKYSIADIAAFAWVSGAPLLGLELAPYPKVNAWVERIAARSAVAKGKNVPEGGRSPEQVKGFFAMMAKKVAAMDSSDKHPSA